MNWGGGGGGGGGDAAMDYAKVYQETRGIV